MTLILATLTPEQIAKSTKGCAVSDIDAASYIVTKGSKGHAVLVQSREEASKDVLEAYADKLRNTADLIDHAIQQGKAAYALQHLLDGSTDDPEDGIGDICVRIEDCVVEALRGPDGHAYHLNGDPIYFDV
jgi:hypothetical protein